MGFGFGEAETEILIFGFGFGFTETAYLAETSAEFSCLNWFRPNLAFEPKLRPNFVFELKLRLNPEYSTIFKPFLYCIWTGIPVTYLKLPVSGNWNLPVTYLKYQVGAKHILLFFTH